MLVAGKATAGGNHFAPIVAMLHLAHLRPSCPASWPESGLFMRSSRSQSCITLALTHILSFAYLQMILFSAMASHILGNRPALYATPGLEPWRGNGGSIINNKLQQMLVRMEKGLGGDGSRMKELTAKAKRKA